MENEKRKGFQRVRTAVAFLAVLLFLFLAASPAQAARTPTIIIDGQTVAFPDQKPYIDANRRTLVPVRVVTENLGAKLTWDGARQQVTIEQGGLTVILTIDSIYVMVIEDGEARDAWLDTRAVLTRERRTMVPLRFVSEILGHVVVWDNDTFTARITKGAPSSGGTGGTVDPPSNGPSGGGGIVEPPLTPPDPQVLSHYKTLDGNLDLRMQSGFSTRTLVSWRSTFLTSRSGSFEDLVELVDIRPQDQRFFFDFSGVNLQNVAWMSLYLSTDHESFDNHFYYDLTPALLRGDTHVIIDRDDFRVGSGFPQWGAANFLRLGFQSKTGHTVTMQPRLFASYSAMPLVTLWLDDGWENAYTNAFRIAREVDPDIRGTVPVIPGTVDTPGYLQVDQIKSMVDAGWEMTNHTFSHPYLPELSDARIEEELVRAYSAIRQWDPRGAYHLAVPYSSVDERVMAIVRQNMVSARYVGEITDPLPFDRYAIGFREVTNVTPFETVKVWIDQAIAQGRWLNLMFHRIQDPSPDRYDYPTGEFRKIVQYLSLRKSDIETVTVHEAFERAGYYPPPGLQ